MCSQWYETFGMVIAEAYSNGTPAIVGDIGNIKDMVIEGITGELFQYDSVEDMVKAIKRFEIKNTGQYGKAGYEFYRHRFMPAANYEILSRIYTKLAE